jgi:hypothetical protein
MSIKTKTFNKGGTFIECFNSYAGVTIKKCSKTLVMDSVYVESYQKGL